jgi:hypothetical protein
MNCPKCSRTMYQGHDECRQVDGGSIRYLGELVYKCINCGTRTALEITPVMPMTAELKANKLPNSRLKDHTLELIRPFIASIKQMRSGKKPESWVTIAALIRQATGSRIKPDTIKRHYYTNMEAV